MATADYQKAWREKHPGYQATYYQTHKAEAAAANLRWRNAHPGYSTAPGKEWRHQLRTEVLAAYGGCCQCCGETEPVFLDIDHIDGATPEGEKKLRSVRLYSWLRKSHWPKGYRILCRNCNWASHCRLECPHQADHHIV